MIVYLEPGAILFREDFSALIIDLKLAARHLSDCHRLYPIRTTGFDVLGGDCILVPFEPVPHDKVFADRFKTRKQKVHCEINPTNTVLVG